MMARITKRYLLVALLLPTLFLTGCTTMQNTGNGNQTAAPADENIKTSDHQGPLKFDTSYKMIPAIVDGHLVADLQWRLENTSNQPVALQAPNPCLVTQWRLLDAAANLLHRPEPMMCIQALAEDSLAPGAVKTGTIPVSAPLTALPVGSLLEVKVWGQKSTLPLSDTRMPDPQGARMRAP